MRASLRRLFLFPDCAPTSLLCSTSKTCWRCRTPTGSASSRTYRASIDGSPSSDRHSSARRRRRRPLRWRRRRRSPKNRPRNELASSPSFSRQRRSDVRPTICVVRVSTVDRKRGSVTLSAISNVVLCSGVVLVDRNTGILDRTVDSSDHCGQY